MSEASRECKALLTIKLFLSRLWSLGHPFLLFCSVLWMICHHLPYHSSSAALQKFCSYGIKHEEPFTLSPLPAYLPYFDFKSCFYFCQLKKITVYQFCALQTKINIYYYLNIYKLTRDEIGVANFIHPYKWCASDI